jgi:arabinofuranosyltransferase
MISTGRIARACVVGLPLLLLALAGAMGGDLQDDTFIFCRYADHLAHGDGAVFNVPSAPEDRVEGYSSPLHLVMIALAVRLGAPAPRAAQWLSLLAGGALLVLLGFAGAPRGSPVLAGPLAAVLTAAAAPFVLWSSTGMDTALFSLAVLGAVIAWERADGGGLGRRNIAWLMVGATFVVRPEGAVLWGVAALFELRRSRRSLARPMSWTGPLLGLVPIALLTLWRLWYYDALVPNTFYAKMGLGGPSLWWRGAAYAGCSMLVLLPLALGAAARRRLDFGVACAAALLVGAVVEGGDHFPMARLAVPVIALVARSAAPWILAVPLNGAARTAIVLAAAVGTCAWTWFTPVSPRNGHGMSEREAYRSGVSLARLFEQVGAELGRTLGPDHSVALVVAGAIPYRTGWRTLDMLGLNDRHIARLPLPLGSGRAGHDKYDVEYVLDQEPEFILLHPFPWREPIPDPEAVYFRHRHKVHEKLIASPRFEREYRLRWLPLKIGYLAIFERRRDAR